MLALFDYNSGARTQTRKHPTKRIELERDAAGGRCETLPRRMDKHRAATPGDARAHVVVNLDDEIIEIVLACESIHNRICGYLDRLIVMAI